MSYKIVLPDKSELPFEDDKTCLKEAISKAQSLNKILLVKEQRGGKWEDYATVFPSGEVRRIISFSSFATSLPVRRR